MKDHNGTNLVYANSVNKIKEVRHLRVTGYTCHRSRVCQWCDQRILQIKFDCYFSLSRITAPSCCVKPFTCKNFDLLTNAYERTGN